jgi:hypothetical protein
MISSDWLKSWAFLAAAAAATGLLLAIRTFAHPPSGLVAHGKQPHNKKMDLDLAAIPATAPASAQAGAD